MIDSVRVDYTVEGVTSVLEVFDTQGTGLLLPLYLGCRAPLF